MLVFERRWLEARIVGADPVLLSVLDSMAAAAPGLPARFSDQVRRVLRSGVLSGRDDAASMADLFSMSERTFRRRLADEGATFHALVAESRLVVARQLLESTRLSVGEIAASLHYSDITRFRAPSAAGPACRPARGARTPRLSPGHCNLTTVPVMSVRG